MPNVQRLIDIHIIWYVSNMVLADICATPYNKNDECPCNNPFTENGKYKCWESLAIKTFHGIFVRGCWRAYLGYIREVLQPTSNNVYQATTSEDKMTAISRTFPNAFAGMNMYEFQ